MKKLSLLMALVLMFLSITGCSNQLAIKDLNFKISEENVEKFLSGVFKELNGYDVELINIKVAHDVDSYEYMQACVKLQTNGLEKDEFYIDFYPKRNSGSNQLYYIEIYSGLFKNERDSIYLSHKIIVEAIEKYLSQESKYEDNVHSIPSFSYGFDYEKSKVSYYLQDKKYECTIKGNDTMGYIGYTYRIMNFDVIKESSETTTTIITNPVATLTVKDYGIIKIELYYSDAPNTVLNFISLANSGFYDGLIFHRVIESFMIQGGDPDGTGSGGPGYSIKGEFDMNGIDNDISHVRGVISMARNSKSYDSAGSQFFICHSDCLNFDGQYAAFGKVIEGMEIVDKIASTKTDNSNKPINNVVIESIKINTNGTIYEKPSIIIS